MVKQKNPKQHSIPKAVTFFKKNELLRVGFDPTKLSTLSRVLYQQTAELLRQLSWLGPNLTSHSAPDELCAISAIATQVGNVNVIDRVADTPIRLMPNGWNTQQTIIQTKMHANNLHVLTAHNY